MIPDWATERRDMVERQLRRRGIRDTRVLSAMLDIPREEFLPNEDRVSSYRDEPAQIGYGQTISQPYMTALMAELLELSGAEKVLDIGSGSGYNAALLAALAARVISIELIPGLAALALHNLQKTGRASNITVVCGDGSDGHPDESPYDAICVTAGAPDTPASLLQQLADPGRLVIPVGEFDNQELRVVTKIAGRISWRVATHCRFVPLRGRQGWR